ncbi:hypothetical protein [Chryseobacterium sp. SIMBA_038]|uniref:hypothetical protein n=1 Tax=Chryseobacterium sp. SIMBA_038 TaxID=3085780 RepID=UPI00397AE8C3
MKKQIIFLNLLLSTYSYSQVGINTENPKSTLDVSIRKDTSGKIDNLQTYGLQPPRLTREELTANLATYGNDQKGSLIYVTDISGGDTAGNRTNITAIGYYYFDGITWQKLENTNGAENIIVDNGLTKTNANISLGGILNKDTDIDNASFNFRFKGAGNVGIGTTTPLAKFDIENKFKFYPGGGAGTSTDDIFEIGGSASGWKRIIAGASNSSLAFYANGQGKATADSPQLFLEGNTGNVGIGTNAPTAKIHMVGSTAGSAFQMQDSSQGAGKFLISDENGKATWSELSTTVHSAKGTIIGNVRTAAGNQRARSYSSVAGSSINLSKGKWMVYIGQMIFSSVASTSTSNGWIRFSLTDTYNPNADGSTDILTQNNFKMPATPPTAGGIKRALVSTSTSSMLTQSVYYAFASGVILVDVINTPNVDDTLTLYMAFEQNIYSGSINETNTFVSNNRENYFMAIPIND